MFKELGDLATTAIAESVGPCTTTAQCERRGAVASIIPSIPFDSVTMKVASMPSIFICWPGSGASKNVNCFTTFTFGIALNASCFSHEEYGTLVIVDFRVRPELANRYPDLCHGGGNVP